MTNPIVRMTNFCGDAFNTFFQKSACSIMPALAGGLGGWLSGVGPQMGLLQGFTADVLYSWCLYPISRYVSDNTGKKPDQFNTNAEFMIHTACLVAEFVVPIYFMSYAGEKVLGALSKVLPSSLVISESAANYSFGRGIGVNILPSITSIALNILLNATSRNRA